MNNLTMKQKIIIGVVVSAMVALIGIYGYSMLGQEDWEQEALIEDENLENELSNQEKIVNKEENVLDAANEIEQNVVNRVDASGSTQDTSQTNLDNINGYENLEGKIVIHITGAVQKTGILVLPEGARIADAINSAGGSTEEADLNEVNLAYVLQDGQKIYIPTKEDKIKLESKVYITSGSGNNVIVQTANIDKSLKNGGSKKVNVNTATQEELESLPGIGPSIASRIIEYRQQNGKFSSIEDLQSVKGIGDAKFDKIKEQVEAK